MYMYMYMHRYMYMAPPPKPMPEQLRYYIHRKFYHLPAFRVRVHKRCFPYIQKIPALICNPCETNKITCKVQACKSSENSEISKTFKKIAFMSYRFPKISTRFAHIVQPSKISKISKSPKLSKSLGLSILEILESVEILEVCVRHGGKLSGNIEISGNFGNFGILWMSWTVIVFFDFF